MNPRRAAVVAVAMTATCAVLAGCSPGTQSTGSPSTSPTMVTTSAAPASPSTTPSPSPNAEPSGSQEWFPDRPAGESAVQAEIRAAWETQRSPWTSSPGIPT